MRHIRHLHCDIPKMEISRNIITLEDTKNAEVNDVVQEHEAEDDNSKNSNDLVIDESVREEETEIDAPVINNRVNVIQSIGNPNKNQTCNVDDLNLSQIMSPQKAESEISLPPKKKAIAIARYNPIEQYRKILGLSEATPNSSPTSKGSDDCEVFPDHWRKRTSQNFLFRR
jgi:hypothetical protein